MAKNEKEVKRLRFSYSDDIDILRQILVYNPFENTLRWKTIQKNVIESTGKNFTGRAVREHLQHLLKSYIKKDKAAFRKSGIEEQYGEKERLLQEVIDLKTEFERSTKNSSKNSPTSQENGQKLRDTRAEETNSETDTFEENVVEETSNVEGEDCMETLYIIREEGETNSGNEQETESQSHTQDMTPITTRKKRKYEVVKSDTLQFLKERQNCEHQIRIQNLLLEEKKLKLEKRRIGIEERKLALEEEKFELQKKVQMERLEIEKKERLFHIQNMNTQQNLLGMLIKKFDE